MSRKLILIKPEHQPHDILFGFELTQAERKAFPHIENIMPHPFVRFGNKWVHDLDSFRFPTST